MSGSANQLSGRIRQVLIAAVASAAFAGTAQGEQVFRVGFDSAGGTTNGSAITGVTGGTATIRDNGGADSTSGVVSDAPDLGGGGFLRAVVPASTASPVGVAPQGATFTPASPASSLAAMFGVVGGQASLNGGFDFFIRPNNNEINATPPGQQFRVLDHSAVGTGGLRIVLSGPSGSSDIRLETITAANGIVLPSSATTNNVSTLSNAAFQMTADNTYHLGVTYSTDAAGTVTQKVFGIQGSGAIDTAATTVATGLLATSTFNFDESIVTSTTGFPTGAYDFGILQTGNSARTQDFDEFRLYNTVPAEFAANVPVPEPTTAAALAIGCIALLSRRRRLA
jgi:hypothetical protein